MPRKRYRLIFDGAGEPIRAIDVERGDGRSAGDAVAVFRAMVRAAIERGGCQTFVVGVHVEGAECDHEVR